jgi:hypothetical protein
MQSNTYKRVIAFAPSDIIASTDTTVSVCLASGEEMYTFTAPESDALEALDRITEQFHRDRKESEKVNWRVVQQMHSRKKGR